MKPLNFNVARLVYSISLLVMSSIMIILLFLSLELVCPLDHFMSLYHTMS